MKKILKPVCRAGLTGVAAMVVGLACAPAALAQARQFTGHWKNDGDGAASVTPSATPSAILTLDGTTLSWRPKRRARPVCSGSFVQQTERPGTVYRNAGGQKFVAGAPGSFPTFLLTIDPGTCGGGADQWRISFPMAYDRRHMELIEYRNGRPIGSRRYQRVD